MRGHLHNNNNNKMASIRVLSSVSPSSKLLFTAAVVILVSSGLVSAEREPDFQDEPLQKRFSMNYLDLIEAGNPRGWQGTMPVTSSRTNKSPTEKRFSMNYLDLVDPKDPVSWRNRLINSDKKTKRFSMNFLDTLGSTDPLSWENTMRTTGLGGNNLAERASRLRQERSLSRSDSDRPQNDLQAKRSPALYKNAITGSNPSQAVAMANNIDALLRYASSAYGSDACRQPMWSGLLRLRASIEPLLPRGHQGFFPEEASTIC